MKTLSMFVMGMFCAAIVAAQPGCNASREPTSAAVVAAETGAKSESGQPPAAAAKGMPETCGMGAGGGCCGACQQAKPKAEDPAAAGGGCPCQKARKAAQGS